MKIVAGLIIRNEADRYLKFALENLAEFVDEVCVVDDASTDDWHDLIPSGLNISIMQLERSSDESFHRHAIGRNTLLHFTLESNPDWIIASDADELFTDGTALRAACAICPTDVLTVNIAEVWQACDDRLCIREDGGWRSHPIGCVWRPTRARQQRLALLDKDTATGRVPDLIHRFPSRASGVSLLHLGWANKSEREARYERHVGSKHARDHVESILWDDSRIKLDAYDWPSTWSDELRSGVLERANRS